MTAKRSGLALGSLARGRTQLFLAVFTTLLAALGCSTDAPSESTLGSSTQAATVDRVLSYSLPPLTASQSVALGATHSLAVRDRSQVRVPAGGYATVSNLATGTTSVGVNAQVGNLWSIPGVALQSNAAVNGFLKTSGVVTPPTGNTVTGGVTENLPIVPEQRVRHVIFPNATSNVDLDTNQTQTLAPGSYLRLNVKTGAKLTLSSGTYYFDNVTFEPNAEIRLNKANGPIYVYVLNAFIHRGKFVDGGGKLANLLVGYFGTAMAIVEAPFLGTLVAPNAKISLATVGAPGHRGAFFGKDIELAPDTTVWLYPFGVTVDPLWSVPTPDGTAEAFTDLAVRADGGLLAATTKRVLSIQANGSATTVFSSAANTSTVFLNRAGTAFGVSAGADVTLRHADGSAFRTYSRKDYEYSVFVPGADKTFFPEVKAGHDHPAVTFARFFDAAGSQLARFSAPGLEVSRLTATDLYYSTGTDLYKVNQAGAQVWHATAALMSFEVSQGSRLIGKLRDGRSVQHFVNGVAQPATALGAPIYRIAIAPQGTYSAVATRQAVQLFQNGVATVAVNVPVTGITALAVSDRGETLLGAVASGGARRAMLIDAQGEVLWDTVLAADTQAFRPGLGFMPGDNALVAREATRVSTFTINRTL
jgi:hypothetical protein